MADYRQQTEIILNEIATDVQVFRTILTRLLISLSRLGDDPAAEIAGLRSEVLATIQRTLPAQDPSRAQDAERRKQFAMMRAELFFSEIDAVLAVVSNAQRQGSSN